MDEEEEIEGLPALFHRHPLLFCFLLFLAFTYAFLYPVFAFILASAPVLILTALLLGLLLLNSVPQDHDAHLYKKISHRPPQSQPSTTATAAIGGSTRHHHQPSDESSPTSDSSSSSSADENYNHPPTMSTATSHASFPDTAANSESESTDSEHEEKQHNHQRSEKKDAVRAVAWTADDDKSIENIGSLELEMNATVEKLMSRRRARGHQRPLHHHHHHVMDLVDIDDPSKLSIATRKSNPFDLDGPYDEDDNFPDSAPSMLGLRPSRNPFFDDMDDDLHLQAPPQPSSIPGVGAAAAQQKNAMLFRRHESFTVGAPYVSDFRPSRFRPYFVTEKMQGQPVSVPEASRKSTSSSTSSSSAGATAYAYAYASANKEEEAAAEQEALAEAEAAAMLEEVKTEEYSSRSHKTEEHSSRSHEVVAVDVELISDSSDDDMTLPGGHAEKAKERQVQVQQQQEEKVAEQEQQMKMEQQAAGEQEQRMKLQQQQLAEQERLLKKQQQLAEKEQRMKLQQQQLAEQEQQMKQQQQLALSDDDDDDDEGDSFEVESITKQVAAAAAGKTKQLEADPAYDYSPSAPAGKSTEKKQQEAAFAGLPPAAPNKLQSMRRVFSEEDADEPWAAPSGLEETTTTTENEGLSAPAAGAAPPLSAAAKKAIGKSTKYKPPTKKAVLGFFRK